LADKVWDLLTKTQIENLKKIIDDLGLCLNGYLKSANFTKHETRNTKNLINIII